MTATRATVSRNGQISIPAAVRHRWGTRSVLVIDRGDYAIVRPIPDDPITALEGAYATPGVSTEDARAAERAAEDAIEERRAASHL
jgi:AbrB family looped-hinge helix DNA binding protein